MKNPVSISFEPYGAQTILTFEGEPREVETTVNRFHNFGMFLSAAVPENYNPVKHGRVVIKATTARVRPSLRALAEGEFISEQSKLPREQRKRGGAFAAEVARRTEEMAARFQRRTISKLVDEPRSAELGDYTVDNDQNTTAFRVSKARLLSAIGRGRRDSASGRAKGLND